MTSDPKLFAADRFSKPTDLLTGLDIIMAYATDVPLAIETLREACRPEAPGARLLELGFGSGYLLEDAATSFPDARLFGLELSDAMIQHVRASLGSRVSLLRGDMEALPFPDDAFDVVATCFTLYFMRDPDSALREMRRVLKPGGKVVVATIAPDHQQEFDDISREALAAVGGAPIDDIGRRFDLETGQPYMRRVFPDFELREWRGVMPLPVDVFVRFWQLSHADQLGGPDSDPLLENVRRLATARSDRNGTVPIRRHDGLLLARKS